MLFRTTLIATLLTATALAAPVTFKDFGVIWICGNYMDYTVWAEAGSDEVMLSQDKPKKNDTLRYDKKSDRYLSKDTKTTLQFKGKDLEAMKIEFLINGRAYKCYYEYIERG
jgi:predicted DNA binding CopG/RHH family protein